MSPRAPYDIQSQAFFDDPYPTLHRIREEDPVHWFEPLRIWLVTRYDHADMVVRDDRRFLNHRARELIRVMMPTLEGEELSAMVQMWSELAWFRDQPDHARLRQFMNKGFTPQAIEGLRPAVRTIAREALAAARDKGEEVDIVEDLADPIALSTITSLFGIPPGDRATFRGWITTLFKGAGGAAMAEDVTNRIKEHTSAMLGYIAALAERRRADRGDDVISRFWADEGAPSPEDIVLQSYQVIVAGYRTSMNQIANTVWTLLRHPAELERLRDDPRRMKGAIEEALRYEPSVVVTNRLAAEDVEIGGKRIKKGELVFPILPAANRDPLVFPDPDRFDITRTGPRHLSFSMGHHYCIGAPLVRVEVEEALAALLEIPRWEPGSGPCLLGDYNLSDRGPKTLPMRLLAS
ncbi:cytochrome P450 [Polyangium sp. 15x6]|uniref:cytochrome P450 n=1 Tax=Polyangium sp. 15x6 TaxID=3042687 RepID=UPI00249AA5D9|nr:cytochrome P450 [Polyangium sp. 15x6]MDI3286621.1 cytochrome P450 [Polyangium sp. 15x6]